MSYAIPNPDELIFMGWFAGGEVFRSGCTFTRGCGKIFYFQPGHEEYPTYYNETVQKIILNAVHWAVPTYRPADTQCIHATDIPELAVKTNIMICFAKNMIGKKRKDYRFYFACLNSGRSRLFEFSETQSFIKRG